MSRASHSKIKICSVKLHWKGPLDWWLIGSQTYKLQKTNRLCKWAKTLSVYIHCRVGLSTVYAESLGPGSGLSESRTQNLLPWITELWRGLRRESDSIFLTLSNWAVERPGREPDSAFLTLSHRAVERPSEESVSVNYILSLCFVHSWAHLR